MVPKGHTQLQKNRPNNIVRITVTRAQRRPLYRELVLSIVATATRGSSCSSQLTGQPLSRHQSTPKVVTMQNQIRRRRKKIWLMRLTVTIRISVAPDVRCVMCDLRYRNLQSRYSSHYLLSHISYPTSYMEG